MHVVDDKHLKRLLDGISVHCTCKEQGYECTGGLREAVKNHHNQQSTTDDLLTGCQFQNVRCEAVQSHQYQCQPMVHHISSSSCAEQGIECEYQYVGCDFRGSQLELDVHMSKAMGTHLSLLSKFLQRRLSQKGDEMYAIKEELKVLQRDRKMKEKLAQQGKIKDVEQQQHTEQSQQVQHPGSEQNQQSKNHIWILILFLFLVVGGVNAYWYQAWHLECSCGQDLHQEQLSDLCVRKIDMDGQVQQLDYRVTLVKTILQGGMDELKLTVSKTNQVIEEIGNDLNTVKEILLRIQQKQSLEMKGSGE